MDPITIGITVLGKLILAKLGVVGSGATLAAIVGAAAAVAVVVISFVSFVLLINWFKTHENKIDEAHIAASLKLKLDNGDKVIVQGIFNKSSGKVKEGRVIKYDKLDSDVKKAHKKGKIVVYE